MNFKKFVVETEETGTKIFHRPRGKEGHKKFLGHSGISLTSAAYKYLQHKTSSGFNLNPNPEELERYDRVKKTAMKQFRSGGLVLIGSELYSTNRLILKNPIEWRGGDKYFQDGKDLKVLT